MVVRMIRWTLLVMAITWKQVSGCENICGGYVLMVRYYNVRSQCVDVVEVACTCNSLLHQNNILRALSLRMG